jgi:parvulin-like peptidyl-prolyl isomerase
MVIRSAILKAAAAVLLLGALQRSFAQQTSEQSADGNPQERVVVSVDTEQLTAADVAEILQSLPTQTRMYYENEGRALLPQYLVRMKVLVQEARKRKLDQQPDLLKTIEIVTESILADAARRQIAQDVSLPEDMVSQYYEAHSGEYEQVRIRRILIRTESSILSESSVPTRPPLSSADARKKLEEIRKQVLEGGDFAELARANSDDGASAASGGDLGFVSYRTLIPPIMQAADRLAPGEVSEIIPTAFGMEMIQVVEKRAQPLEEVRPLLEATLRQGKLEEKLQELQNQYKIAVDNEFFAPQTAAPMPFGTVVPEER